MLSSIFLTFQFYRFPQVTTERLSLAEMEGDLSNDMQSVPFILKKIDKTGQITQGQPGYEVKYDLDPGYMKSGEKRLFLDYLSRQTLHIDVWDADSLHLVGSAAVELKVSL